MSMLSAQCDKLRELADRFDGLAPENAALMRSVADTIWELRCKLNDEWDENAKLRELVADMWGFIESTDEDCGDVTFSSCFDYCKHDTVDDGCSKTGECWYEHRMRELGMEMD